MTYFTRTALFFWMAIMISTVAAEPKSFRVYIGTYTQGASEGIYQLKLDMASGKLTMESVTKTSNPSFLAIHPSQKFLYAVNEVGTYKGNPGGGITSFAIDKATGKLTELNTASTVGAAPCHLVIDNSGKHVLVANYTGGNAVAFAIGSDGKLNRQTALVQHKGSSVNPQRQKGPHAHSINLDSANRFAFVADLGLDQVLVYRFNTTTGTLEPNNPAYASIQPGGGPRHFAFHPNGKFAYVNHEMTSKVTAFAYDKAKGSLMSLQTLSSLPADFKGSNSTAEIQVSPDGRFVFCSNRGHNSIVMYSVDSATGKLKSLWNYSTQGKTPRNFGIDPTGKYILAANQSTDNIAVLRIKADGLEDTGQRVKVPTPVCVKFMAID